MNLVQLSKEPRLTPFHMACRLPGDPQFRAYLCDLASVDDVTPETATIWMRTICEVESRRELATDPEAAHRFETLVRRPFVAWRRDREAH